MGCIVEGCDRPNKGNGCARGYCGMHYLRWLKHGDPRVTKINRQRDHEGCLIDGCDAPHSSKGYCQTHYLRLKHNGSPHAYNPRYKCRINWIRAHVSYDGDDCLKWPFEVSAHGRGRVNINTKAMTAPRGMCTLAHGEPPTPKHHAAHICGNGHLGCMNPRHLVWKTPKENEGDKVAHGTLRKGTSINTNKLTEDQVKEIRALRGKMKGVEIAERYGITPANVSNIMLRKIWAWL